MKPVLPIAALAALAACSNDNPQPNPSPTPSATMPAKAVAGAAASPAAPVDDEAARLLAVQPQPGPLAPRDECAKAEGAHDFRSRMAQAIVRKDGAAFAALADTNVKLGFGGKDGRARLQERLTGGDQGYFGELRAAMALGCAIDERGAMVMPWYFAQDAKVDDPFMAMLVTGADVPVLAKAAASAQPVATVSWDAVTLVDGLKPGVPFQKVATRGGKTGFVATGKLRSLLATRILAERGAQGWRITAIVAGD